MSRAIDADAVEESWPLLSRFRQYGVPHAHVLLAGLTGTVTKRVVMTAAPFVIGVAIDAMFNEQAYALPLIPGSWIPAELIDQLWFTVGVLASIYLIQAVANYAGNHLRGVFGHLVRHDLRVDAYATVQRLEMAFFDDEQTGEIMSILNNDVDELQGFFKDEIAIGLDQATQIGATIVFMSLLNPQLTLLTFVLAPIFAAGSYWFGGKIEALQTEVRRAVGELNARLEDSVDGIEVIKASATEPFEAERVESASREALRTKWNRRKLRMTFYPVINLLGNGTYLLTFVIGGYWVVQGAPTFLVGTLTAGELVPFLFYTQDISWALQTITRRVDSYKSARAAATRVAAIQRTDVTIEEAEDAVELEDVEGRVAYDDVTFGYDPDEPVIEDVSFEAAPGETVGIVGPTGAGKSTIAKLLLRFYDVDDGEIRIDGHDVREVTLRSLRESIGYVSQEPFLFHGTIAENVAYGDPGATDDEIREAARLANAHEFVEDLPEGYDTEVGERGGKLSGGQRQRIAIARAILSDPPILIFDEATSHVDNETEVLIQHSMQRVTEDRTTFVIAHRLSTVRDADRILVFEDGGIVERGDHETLLDADGDYATLWGIQVGQVDSLSEEFLDRAADAR